MRCCGAGLKEGWGGSAGGERATGLSDLLRPVAGFLLQSFDSGPTDLRVLSGEDAGNADSADQLAVHDYG